MSANHISAVRGASDKNVSEKEVKEQKPKRINDSFKPKRRRRKSVMCTDVQSPWKSSMGQPACRLIKKEREESPIEEQLRVKQEGDIVPIFIKSEEEEEEEENHEDPAELTDGITDLDCLTIELPATDGKTSNALSDVTEDEDDERPDSELRDVNDGLEEKSTSLKDTDSGGEKKKKWRRGHFVCDVCNKVFTRKSTLKSHMIVHTGEKPFICDICSKCFVYNSNLRAHMSLHSREKPFVCQICNKNFNRKTHLKTHMIVHTGEKSFVCNQCGKVFSRSSTLNTHMRVHTGEKPFGCIVCGHSFSRNMILRRHMRIHTGERPFTCGECGQSFTCKSHLIQHLRIHTGEKPFDCKVCGKSFRQDIHLRNHKKTHQSPEKKKTNNVSEWLGSFDGSGKDFPKQDF